MDLLPEQFALKLQARTLTEEELKALLANYSGKEKKDLKKLFYSGGGGSFPVELTTKNVVEDNLQPKRIDIQTIFRNRAGLPEKESDDRLTEECENLFDEMDNPYEGVMDYYKGFPDIVRPSDTTLSAIFLQKFTDWTMKEAQKERKIYHLYRTDSIMESALKMLMTYHTFHLAAANGAFNFPLSQIRAIAVPRIEEYAKQKKYALALEYSLRARVPMPTDVFLLPRLLEQDGFEDVKKYCEVFSKHQKEMVQALNALILKEGKYFNGLCNYMSVRYDDDFVREGFKHLDTKTVKKYLKNLIYTFDLEKLEKQLAPDYWWHIRDEMLHYVRKRYFCDKELDYYSYITKTMMCFKGVDHVRVEEYVAKLWQSSKQEEMDQAFIWMMIYGLDDDDIPESMLKELNKNPQAREFYHRKAVEIYPRDDLRALVACDKQICMVDSEKDLIYFMREVLPIKNLFGIDVETVDEIFYQKKMVLFQLAVDDRIFIFDFILLDSRINESLREAFFQKLIQGDGLKLGFDFGNDLLSISQKYQTKYREQNKNCLDLKDLIQNILEKHPDFLGEMSEEEVMKAQSLNDASKRILGKALDKSMQQSNWAARPLKKKQIIYAATDAEILIQLYEGIKAKALEKDIDLASFEAMSMIDSIKNEKIKKKKIEDMSWSEIVDTLNGPELDMTQFISHPQDFKFATAQHLDLLGKNLRRCGFDVMLCSQGMPSLDVVAESEKKRILCCSGKTVNQMRTKYPKRVWEFGTTLDFVLLTKNAIQKAKVKLNKEDIFTRCVECNQVGFLMAPMPVIQALHHRHVVFFSDIYSDEIFDVKVWKEKLKELSLEEYGDATCLVEEEDESFRVRINNGRIDILSNEVLGTEKTVQTSIRNIPANALIAGRVFYICSHCGKIYYDKDSSS